MAETLYVLVPLAHDAIGSKKSHVYTNVGHCMQQRIIDALWYREANIPRPYIWLFGAGTTEEYQRGPTLAQLAAEYMRYITPEEDISFNTAEKNFYGSLEEIKWSVKEIARTCIPGTVRFVFFAPWWHLWRVRCIWRLFFQKTWGKATFVVTQDDAPCMVRHEIKAWGRIFLVYFGWRKSRDQIPYPPITGSHGIECE